MQSCIVLLIPPDMGQPMLHLIDVRLKNLDNNHLMKTKIIGDSLPRIDARGKVTGETQYPGDITMPNQAYMKILFARRPHALIKSIDINQDFSLLDLPMGMPNEVFHLLQKTWVKSQPMSISRSA